MTQKTLGVAAGIHPNTVAKLERGEVEPSWQVVLVVSKALGVDCSAFSACEDVTGAEPEKPAAKRKGRK